MSDDPMVGYLLGQIGDDGVTSRSMFGGHGIYKDGRMFGLVYSGTVYMKFSEQEAATSQRAAFSPAQGKTFRSLREVSADEIDDPQTLRSLADDACKAAGERSSKGKR